jgi:Icc-related predicted phosphoesterase
VTVSELDYRYARKGGGVAVRGRLAVETVAASGLPDALDGIVLTADLQGRQLLPATRNNPSSPARSFREGRKLLGEVVAGELTRLSASGRLPGDDRLGVVLAGDFWAEPGCIRRGRSGDVLPVWQAFREGRRWVVGVRGNHDILPEGAAAGEAGMYVLNGSSVTLDGLRFGGLGGVIGNPSKPRMRSEERFTEAIRSVVGSGVDVLVLHQGPAGDGASSPGSRAIRESLSGLRDALVVFGHCFWRRPIQDAGEGRQLVNVDSRVLVLLREGWMPPSGSGAADGG